MFRKNDNLYNFAMLSNVFAATLQTVLLGSVVILLLIEGYKVAALVAFSICATSVWDSADLLYEIRMTGEMPDDDDDYYEEEDVKEDLIFLKISD